MAINALTQYVHVRCVLYINFHSRESYYFAIVSPFGALTRTGIGSGTDTHAHISYCLNFHYVCALRRTQDEIFSTNNASILVYHASIDRGEALSSSVRCYSIRNRSVFHSYECIYLCCSARLT